MQLTHENHNECVVMWLKLQVEASAIDIINEFFLARILPMNKPSDVSIKRATVHVHPFKSFVAKRATVAANGVTLAI